jgi:hypothetical protein
MDFTGIGPRTGPLRFGASALPWSGSEPEEDEVEPVERTPVPVVGGALTGRSATLTRRDTARWPTSANRPCDPTR